MNKKNKPVIIITGITSFLGSEVAKFLIKKEYNVIGITYPNSKSLYRIENMKKLNIITIDFDKIDINSISKKYVNDKYLKIINKNDFIFLHFGWADTNNRNDYNLQIKNLLYSKKVLLFSSIINTKKFIFAGSQAEKSNSKYGMVKREFANYAKKFFSNTKTKFIHLRIHSVFGKYDGRETLISELIKSIKENSTLKVSSLDYDWNYLYINDFVNIIYKIIIKDIKQGTYDVGSLDTRQLKNYVEEVLEVLSAKNAVEFGMLNNSLEKFSTPNIDMLLKEIGQFKFTKFKDAILKIYNEEV